MKSNTTTAKTLFCCRTCFSICILFSKKLFCPLDVMTELVNLMTETNCSPGSSAPQPQHPSDFTRRYTAVIATRMMKLWSRVSDQAKPPYPLPPKTPNPVLWFILAFRNYQRRWRNLVPSVTLQEWQLKHCETGKRFANVSNHFRSSLSSF